MLKLIKNKELLFAPIVVTFYFGCGYKEQSSPNTEDIQIETKKFLNGESKVVGALYGGKKNGLWLNYNDSGNLESFVTYQEDSLIGQEIVLNSDGKIFIIHDLFGEAINGEWTVYHDYSKGTIAERGKYLNGVKVGIWEYFDENGILFLREEYSSGGMKKTIDRRRELKIESFPPNNDSINSVEVE